MYKLITAPTIEPVSVSELKSQLRITSSSQDTMLGVLIEAARQHAEEYLRYSIMSATWELYLDAFPKSGESIWIQKSPVSEITSLKYVSGFGVVPTLTTMTVTTDYIADVYSMPARIYESYGATWPTPLLIPNAVICRFVSGYATAAAVPDVIRQAILMIAATMYENPADEISGTITQKYDYNSEWLLRPLRAMRF